MKGENISGTSVELVKIRLKKGTGKTRSDREWREVKETEDSKSQTGQAFIHCLLPFQL